MKMTFMVMLVLVGSSIHAQNDDSLNFKRHELGTNWSMRAGRITPGLQYYYGIKPNQQLGIGVSMRFGQLAEGTQIFSPEAAISYRWRWELFKGFSVFIEPKLSYSFTFITNIPMRHSIGAGINSGLEYDFSKISNAPLILGFSFNSLATYSHQQFGYSISPQLSLRFKF